MKCYSCSYDWPEVTEENPLCNVCEAIRDDEGDDSASTEYYEDRFIEIGPKRWKSIKRSGNVHPCSECERPIFGVPLLLWGEEGETMVAFCAECAEKYVISYMMKPKSPSGSPNSDKTDKEGHL